MIDAARLDKMIRKGGMGCVIQAKMKQDHKTQVEQKLPASIEVVLNQYTDVFDEP